MIINAKESRFAATTLVEVMAAILVLAVTVIGAAGFRYYAALEVRESALQRGAIEIGQLLCESWCGVKGSETFDPAAYFGSELSITATVAPAGFGYSNFTSLGTYLITQNGVDYYAALSGKDINTELRALNIMVAWPRLGQQAADFSDAYRIFKLTTYASK